MLRDNILDSNRELKQHLLKEASTRIAPSERVYDYNLSGSESKIASDLLKEAADRLYKLRKSAMAAHSGDSELRNSTSNVKWTVTLPTDRTKKIDADIYQVFKDYLYMKVNGKRVGYEAGTYYPLPSENGDRIELADKESGLDTHYPYEPDANLVLRFTYKRNFLPINDEEYLADAERSIDLLDKLLPQEGSLTYKNFISELQRLNIPIKPFFHTTEESEELGGINSKNAVSELQKFLVNEHRRLQKDPLTLADGTPISSAMYTEHADRINNGERLSVSRSEARLQKYSRDRVYEMNNQAGILSAIRHKFVIGYRLNQNDLNSVVQMRFKEWMNMHLGEQKAKNITIESTSLPRGLQPHEQARVLAYQQEYTEYRDSIISWFEKGCLPKPEFLCPYCYSEDVKTDQQQFGCNNCGTTGAVAESHVDWHEWGQDYGGLPVRNPKSKHARCPVLTIDQLRDLLWSMSDHHPDLSQYVRKSKWSQLSPNEIHQPGEKIIVSSNGWDTKGNGTQAPLIPGLKRIKELDGSHKFVYNTDQANLGLVHLQKNGKDLEQFIIKWGAWCDQCFKALQSPSGSTRAVSELARADEEGNGFSIDAWMNTIGGQGPNGNTWGNRTNAEAILELLGGYDDYDTFRSDFLEGQSLAGRGSKSLSESQRENLFGPEGFPYLKYYGYQMSKLMDFSRALMDRICEEETSPGMFSFGRGYSTSSGKGDFGNVIVGVKYAFNALSIEQNDPNTLDVLKKQYQARHIKYKDGFPVRETAWPEGGTPAPQEFQPQQDQGRTVIMNDITYWIGVSSSDFRFAKTYDSIPTWSQCISRLVSLYPAIRDQLGAEIEPINADLKSLEKSAQKAFSAAADKLRSEGVAVNAIFGGDVIPGVPQEVAEKPYPTSPETVPSATEKFAPKPPKIPSPQPQSSPTPQPTPVQPDLTPIVDDVTEKSMVAKPMSGFTDFVGKKNDKRRRLIKNTPIISSQDNAVVNLAKIANKLDQCGEVRLASKIDFILSKIFEQNNDN